MFGKFGNSTLDVSRQEFNLKLGKISFHGNRGYCLGHKISTVGLEVDQAKVSIIKTLLQLQQSKG